jgi:hypothetical protein
VGRIKGKVLVLKQIRFMKNIKKYIFITGCALTVTLMAASCKVEDPFLDRAASPLLVDIVGAPFGAPIAAEPTVTYPLSTDKIAISARLLELDKTNILDHTKGIDSIPVPNVQIQITMRTGAALGTVTSDASGLVKLEKTWDELGVTAPKSGSNVKISWSGTYKGIAYTRLSQVQVQ